MAWMWLCFELGLTDEVESRYHNEDSSQYFWDSVTFLYTVFLHTCNEFAHLDTVFYVDH